MGNTAPSGRDSSTSRGSRTGRGQQAGAVQHSSGRARRAGSDGSPPSVSGFPGQSRAVAVADDGAQHNHGGGSLHTVASSSAGATATATSGHEVNAVTEAGTDGDGARGSAIEWPAQPQQHTFDLTPSRRRKSFSFPSPEANQVHRRTDFAGLNRRPDAGGPGTKNSSATVATSATGGSGGGNDGGDSGGDGNDGGGSGGGGGSARAANIVNTAPGAHAESPHQHASTPVQRSGGYGIGSVNPETAQVLMKHQRARRANLSFSGADSMERLHPPTSREVAYATLEWMVVAMTDAARTDYGLRDTVLLLHPCFAQSMRFARALVLRYDLCAPEDAETDKLEGSSQNMQDLNATVLSMLSVADTDDLDWSGGHVTPPLNRSVSEQVHMSSPATLTPSSNRSVFPNDSPESGRLRVQLKVLSVLSKWIKSSAGDRDVIACESDQLAVFLGRFLLRASKVGSSGQQRYAEGLLTYLHTQREISCARRSSGSDGGFEQDEMEGIMCSVKPENFGTTFYRHTAKQVAQTLTLEAHERLLAVSSLDLCGKAFARGTMEQKESASPTVMANIKAFNERVRWVCAVLLCGEKGCPAQRSPSGVSFFINVATECIHLKNFQSALEIITALSTPAIQLLTNQLVGLSDNARAQYDKLKRLLSHQNNYEQYRYALEPCTSAPHVPALPVVTKDLIKLEDGCKSFHSRNPKLIHIAKFRAIWSKIESFLRCQKHAYQQSHMTQRGAWARRLIKSSSSSPRSTSAATKTSGSAGGNANRTNAMGELAFTIRCWLYPPPPEMELYKCARQILAKESDNLVRTLDYLGL